MSGCHLEKSQLKTVLQLDSEVSMVQLQVYSFGFLQTCILYGFHCTSHYGT